MLDFLTTFAVVLVALALVVLTPIYLAYCFTGVKEGRFRIVVRGGAFQRAILVKEGHKLDSNGNISELAPGEKPKHPRWMGGWRWVGWLRPLGIDRIFTKDEMKFKKSSDNGTVENRDLKGEKDFLAAVDYPYAIPFENYEDRDNIPITGHATLVANVSNPYKSTFATTNFYNIMIQMSVGPAIRECLENYAFTELEEKKKKGKKDLDELLWAYISDSTKNPQQGSTDSVVDELWKKYGIRVVALRVIQLDPPTWFREKATAKRAAQLDADKATEETAGRILKSAAMNAGLSVKDLSRKIKKNPELKGVPNAQGGFKEDFDYARDQTKRDRAGSGLRDVRVGNADGTNLEPVTAMVASLIGLVKGGDNSDNAKGGKGDSKEDEKESKRERKMRELDDSLQKKIEQDKKALGQGN